MGFFSTTGGLSHGGDFETAEEGVYLSRLKEVVPETRNSFDDPSVQEEVYRWVFETTEDTDSHGNPYKFVQFTKRLYGNEKANLTKLIDGMLGRHLTQEEYQALDLDILSSRRYKVMVTEHTTGTGKVVNKIMSVKPAQGQKNGQQAPTMGQMGRQGVSAPSPKRVVQEDPEDDETSDLKDPFAD